TSRTICSATDFLTITRSPGGRSTASDRAAAAAEPFAAAASSRGPAPEPARPVNIQTAIAEARATAISDDFESIGRFIFDLGVVRELVDSDVDTSSLRARRRCDVKL